jgi:hypothetical protein
LTAIAADDRYLWQRNPAPGGVEKFYTFTRPGAGL